MTNQDRARELWQRTRAEKFVVGAFNIDNQETLIAVARAAKKNSPVLVEVSQGEVDAIGLKNVRCMVDNYRDEYGIEIYINLDHSPSIDAAKKGIDAGAVIQQIGAQNGLLTRKELEDQMGQNENPKVENI